MTVPENLDQADLEGTRDVLLAAERLARAGLASRSPRGINNDGVQTLSDLLAVATFQFGAGQTQAEQTASATAQAMMAALADVLSEIRGDSPDQTATLQLLTAAVRQARGA